MTVVILLKLDSKPVKRSKIQKPVPASCSVKITQV